MKALRFSWLLLSTLALNRTDAILAQGTTFTYQGILNDAGGPANGSYDLTFSVFDASSIGNQVSGTRTNTRVGVTNGLFTAILDLGDGIFTGPERWLEISVRTNGANNYTVLSPRQTLTPTPYSIMANTASNLLGTLPTIQLSGTLGDAQLSPNIPRLDGNATFTGAVSLGNPANFLAGNGTGLMGVNATALGGLSAESFWKLGGNAISIPGASFLGTTDNQALEFRVNGLRAYRLEPTTAAPNVIGGASGNQVATGSIGVTISGGDTNLAGSEVAVNFVTLGGGMGNTVFEGSDFSTISGGAQNSVSSNSAFSTISGGCQNHITLGYYQSQPDNSSLTNSTIGGGVSNTIWVGNSVIGGGIQNTIGLEWSSPHESGHTIGGGTRNVISYDNIMNSTISGGVSNYVDSHFATIAGGSENAIDWAGDSFGNSIGGGGQNYILGNYSTVGGGQSNLVKGLYSVIPGGISNSVTSSFSFAAGRLAFASHQGAFVWADSSDVVFPSTRANEFSARCTGGARFVSAIDADGVPVGGVELVAGGGSWSTLSDRNAKENFAPINPRDILDHVTHIPITTWNYKSQSTATRHIGPMAQDFAGAFHVGENNKRITTVDADGVALAAIQGLAEIVQEQRNELKQKTAEIVALEKRIDALERTFVRREISQSEARK